MSTPKYGGVSSHCPLIGQACLHTIKSMHDPTELVGPHCEGILEQVVDDELILYNPNTESYFTLNRSAREVWELADGTMHAHEIALTLAERYGIASAALENDIAEIIDSFHGADLI